MMPFSLGRMGAKGAGPILTAAFCSHSPARHPAHLGRFADVSIALSPGSSFLISSRFALRCPHIFPALPDPCSASRSRPLRGSLRLRSRTLTPARGSGPFAAVGHADEAGHRPAEGRDRVFPDALCGPGSRSAKSMVRQSPRLDLIQPDCHDRLCCSDRPAARRSSQLFRRPMRAGSARKSMARRSPVWTALSPGGP